ncbi:MAG: AAA family ATPase [Methylobacter sp.]|nr:AAA family ATPase [Methylobacter sp.]
MICRQPASQGGADTDFLLVEGAGGLYSPLASDALNADLAAALSLPVLLVAADRLGTIGHTLMAVEAIRQRGLTLAGVVLNRFGPHGDPLMDNVTDLSRWLGQPVLVTDRFEASTTDPGWLMLCPALGALADRLTAG